MDNVRDDHRFGIAGSIDRGLGAPSGKACILVDPVRFVLGSAWIGTLELLIGKRTKADLLRVLSDHKDELEVVHAQGDIEELIDVSSE